MADHDGIEGLHGAGALQPPAAVPPGRHGTYASWPPAGTPIGSGWPPAPYPAPYPAPVATKSAGIAVLLSFLWPGLGHLYVGQIGAGVALICAELMMIMFSFLIITLIVTVPVGLALLVAAAATAASAAQDYRPSGMRGA